MSGIVKEVIESFIKDTSVPKLIDKSVISGLVKKRYKKSSRIIHYKGSKPVNSEIIINETGIGKLRELSIISEQKMNPFLEVDGVNTLSSISSWDELAKITLYTKTIVAQTNGADFILSFNDLNFKKNIFLRVDFENKGTISRVFGTYDLCEEF